jgi:outer membrane protein TolC
LPSELLHRRPDVAQAEANLASAHANVTAARAAFFPAIGLTASGGTSSAALSKLFSRSGLVWSIGASVLQTIFDGGARRGQLTLSRAQQMEAVADYRRVTLDATLEQSGKV